MADELPPAPSETDDASKAETIRITLPAKPDAPAQKRETVRINLPGKPAGIIPPAGIAPKKETTKITTGSGIAMPPPPGAPGGAKPFVPPPPASKPGLGAPPPPSAPRVMSGVNPPPKPPSLSGRPTVPLKPAPLGGASGINPPLEPVTQRAASPKKETARITLPAEGGAKPAMPKATVKMQQTQPLVRQPSAIQTSPTLQSAPAPVLQTVPAGPDTATTVMSIAALIFSLAALGLAFWGYSASALVQ